MDSYLPIEGMEFLDLSDATDDERRDAMEIIGSCPPGIELPFGCKTNTITKLTSSSPESGHCPPIPSAPIDTCSSPSLARDTPPQSLQMGIMPHQSHSHQQGHVQHHWDHINEMSVSSGGSVVCTPTSFIYQTPPHYFAANTPMTHYFPAVSISNDVSGINATPSAVKDAIKMRSIVVNTNGKSIKSERPPFFTHAQYPEVPPMDHTRQPQPPPLANLDVTMANMGNAGPPPIPSANYPPQVAFGFPPGTFPPFPAPVYLIPHQGSYFQVLSHGIQPQMQRPSTPPSVPEEDAKEIPFEHVPLQHDIDPSSGVTGDESENLLKNCHDHVTDENSETNEENENIEQQLSDRENDCIETDSKEIIDLSHETLSQSQTFTNTVSASLSSSVSLPSSSSSYISSNTIITSTNTTNSVGTASGQRSWADLFKYGTIHSPSLMTSSISSNSSVLSNNLVHGAYNNATSSEDLTLCNNSVDNSDSDAQILAIPMHQDPFAPILASKLRKITLKHSIPYLIPCGFVNRGNWCYINASLQALLSCPPFYNLMREIGDTPGLFRKGSSTPIIDSFARFFTYAESMKKPKTMVSAEDFQKGDTVEPKCIYDVLGFIKSECLKGRQEDAEEFLSSVLNGLHDEMSDLLKLSDAKKPLNGNHFTANGHIERDENDDASLDYEADTKEQESVDDQENLWKEVGSRHKALPTRTAKFDSTPISDIFGGSIISVRTAGKESVGNRQSFFALQLDIQPDKVRSVEDALKCLNTSESIHGYTCPKTKQVIDACNQIFLDTLPPVLIIHLKLFVYDMDGGCRKLMKRIEYPVDLELPRECLHKNDNSSRRYKLLGVVYHDGNEAIKGHYMTDVYHIGSNQWLRCDDGSIKVINTATVLHNELPRTPYLLFYRRNDTLSKNSGFSAYSTHYKGQKPTYVH